MLSQGNTNAGIVCLAEAWKPPPMTSNVYTAAQHALSAKVSVCSVSSTVSSASCSTDDCGGMIKTYVGALHLMPCSYSTVYNTIKFE
jgi:hypothetical protein